MYGSEKWGRINGAGLTTYLILLPDYPSLVRFLLNFQCLIFLFVLFLLSFLFLNDWAALWTVASNKHIRVRLLRRQFFFCLLPTIGKNALYSFSSFFFSMQNFLDFFWIFGLRTLSYQAFTIPKCFFLNWMVSYCSYNSSLKISSSKTLVFSF